MSFMSIEQEKRTVNSLWDYKQRKKRTFPFFGKNLQKKFTSQIELASTPCCNIFAMCCGINEQRRRLPVLRCFCSSLFECCNFVIHICCWKKRNRSSQFKRPIKRTQVREKNIQRDFNPDFVSFGNEKRFSSSYALLVWNYKNSAKEQLFQTKLPKIDFFVNRFGRVVYLGICFKVESSLHLCEEGGK